MRWDKAGKKKRISSILITLGIIMSLILAGPVSAVRVDLKTDKAVYSRGASMVTFTGSVDIQRNEAVPFENLTLRINDDFKVCSFDVDGSHNCPNITITLLNPGVAVDDDLVGRGFGFENEGENPSTVETEFGFGYGFDNEIRKSGLNGELLYEIKWAISSEEVPNGRYEAVLEAFAEENGNMFTYLTRRSKKFNIRLDPIGGPLVIRETARARGSYAEHASIGNDTVFSRERGSLNANLRKVTNGHEEIGGSVSYTGYAETPAGEKIQLQVRMREFEEVSFAVDNIELNGEAQLRYSKSMPGAPTERIRMNIDGVNLKIIGGKVFLASNNPTLPFDVELTLTRFSFR